MLTFLKKNCNGKIFEDKSGEIPVGTNFDDILTAFYNFRNEVYGKLEKRHKTLTVQIRTDEEEKRLD